MNQSIKKMQHNTSVRFRCGFAATLHFVLLAASSRASADYPIASHRYLADPGAMVYDGRVYLYNSNDDDNDPAGSDYRMKSIVCVSSSDLKNWTDHGEVFRVPTNATWASNSWAPAVVERGGKFYLYFGNSAGGVGVASSTTPTGVFKDAKGGYLVNSSTPGASGTNSWLFDPSVFIDDDGQAYLTFGGNGDNNARVIKLNSDMISVSGSAAALTVKNFYEASWLYKRNGVYYFTYSTNTAAGLTIDYMTSSSPTSGFTYKGTVAGQPPSNNNNNHHSDFEFNGNWYHAYHNRIVATQAGISTTYCRNLGIESLSYNADGTIQQVTYTTDGVTQLGNLNPYVRVEAETMSAQSGIETEVCTEGGMDVTSISAGDWIKVRGVDFGSAGAGSFSARVASAASGGSIELRLGSATGTLIGTCTVPGTGGAQTWVDATCTLTGATGVKDLYLKFTGSSFNVNYWQFTPTGGVAGAGGSSSTGGGSSTDGGSSTGGASNAGGARAGGGTSSIGGTSTTGGSGTQTMAGTSNAGGTRATGGSSSAAGGVEAITGGTQAAGGSMISSGGATTSTNNGGSATATTTTIGGVSSNGGSSTVAATNLPGIGSSGYSSGAGSVSIGGGNSMPDASTDPGGCGCRVAENGDSSRSLWSIAMLGAALAARRRRRSGRVRQLDRR